MDKAGYHALVCKSGGFLGVRHNALRDEVFRACSTACLAPKRETPFLLPNSADRPADVFLPYFSLGKPVCLDCACTHTLQPKFVTNAGECTGAAAERYQVEVKEKRYAAKCEKNGLLFIPLVAEVFGVWGSSAVGFFKQLVKMLASTTGMPFGETIVHFMQRLSVTLQRCNVRALLARLNPNISSLEERVR